MYASYWIGKPGVPVILRNMTGAEVRSALQPETPREEYLLTMLEETHSKLLAAIELSKDFDESDDEEAMRYKMSLIDRATQAERRLEGAKENRSRLRVMVRKLILAQGMVASQTDRFQMILDTLLEIDKAMNSYDQQIG